MRGIPDHRFCAIRANPGGPASGGAIDIAYDGTWGYHPLLVSLANTNEPLFIVNRSGSRPLHEGATPVFDLAIALCEDAGFRDVMLRGDPDFALTTSFDHWTEHGVRFVFGHVSLDPMLKRGEGTALPAPRCVLFFGATDTISRGTGGAARSTHVLIAFSVLASSHHG